MSRTISFAEILIESALSLHSEKPVEPTRESILDPSALTYLVAQLQPYRRPIPRYKGIPPNRPLRVLTPEQQSALSELSRFSCTPLSSGFTAKELKSVYRKALIKNHPDHGGNTQSFYLVKKYYELLSLLVKT